MRSLLGVFTHLWVLLRRDIKSIFAENDTLTLIKMTLKELKIGQTCRVISVGGEGALRQHFLDMGVIPETEIRVVKFAPMGDPMQIRVHGYELTMRLADAAKIEVEKIEMSREDLKAERRRLRIAKQTPDQEHPGFGESGRYHDKSHEKPLPDGTKLTFALAGNQNCGKTTLFNQLTGANQHVGNFPGVTVDRKSGQIRDYSNTELVDLPGIYSLSPFSSEEIVSRDFIIKTHPHGIINVVDTTNIERNLFLTMQLMELGIPMVLALNMMDEIEANGGTIRINEMEELLGIPVIAISAMKNQGVHELIQHAIHIAKYQEAPARQDFCSPEDHGGAVHRCLHAIMHLIEDHAQKADIPIRFAAAKIVENDPLVLEALQLSQNERETIEHILRQMEEERGLDRSAAIADMRFDFISDLCKKTVVKPQVSKEHLRSLRFDKVLTGRWTALPSFVIIMALVFWLTFSSLGAWIQGLLEQGIDYVTMLTDQALTRLDVNAVIHSLIIDGIFSGVGSILSFVPLIILLFFFLSLLEDSGYMARIAFVTDHILRKIGLSGRSIVPMLIGFGCSVPSVMASRTLPSERDRKLTIMLTPFMSCTAKLPVYAFFTAVFFPHNSGLVICLLYLLGILTGILTALVLKCTLLKGEAVPFVMELPNYRMPGAKNVARLLWDKAKDFIQRAFTVIFVASIVIWFFQTFNFHLNVVSDSKDSMLAVLADFAAPVFAPLGFGDWRIVTALVSGFMAKESVVSTLSVLFGGTGSLLTLMTTASSVALLVFCLLYTPCVAAIAAIRRELGPKYAVGIVVLQCAIAWVVALVVKLLFLAIV